MLIKPMKKQVLSLLIIVSFALALSACNLSRTEKEGPANVKPESKTEVLLGTVCTITIYDKPSDKIFNMAFNRIRDIENKMSINIDRSEVISINDKSGHEAVRVSDETFYVIQKGVYHSSLSGGNFDITIGPLVKLWNIAHDNAKVPEMQQAGIKRGLVNYKDVVLDESQKTVMLKREGMILDLGGIAKGHAADSVAEVLRKNGVKHAIINLGGDVVVLGSKVDGSKWRIGVQNPFSKRGEHLGVIQVVDKTVVTSGIYERYLEEGGKKYHHILDPSTGFPVENNLAGVTIITDKSIDADSLSTAVFVLGLEKGMQLIESLRDVEAVLVTQNSEVYITSGILDNFKLSDASFKLVNGK
jgi:FAD:protein FMN transferase